MSKTLFQKIADKEIPADIIYEDDVCIAFNDISPQAPVHVLLVPRKPIPRIGAAAEEDQSTLGHLMLMVGKIARQLGIDDTDKGFRVVMNHGSNGGETVPHLHIHILGDRKLEWPPG